MNSKIFTIIIKFSRVSRHWFLNISDHQYIVKYFESVGNLALYCLFCRRGHCFILMLSV